VLKTTRKLPPVKLVLCSASYRFGDGEQFLETELPYLARAFDHIVVVPATVRGTARPVPRHVLVDTSLASIKLRRPSGVLQAMRAAGSSSLCRGELWAQRSLIARRPHVIRRLLAFYLRAEQFRRWLRHQFQGGDVPVLPVVYSYWLSPLTLGAGLARTQIRGLRVVSRAHRHDLYEEVHSPAYIPFRHATLSRVDAVYSVSLHGAEYLRRRFPACRERIHVARLGVNDPRFACPASSDGILRVVSCSFVIPVKRVDLIVRALKELGTCSSQRRIHWVHIGAGPVLPEIRMMAEAVQTLAGTLPEKKVDVLVSNLASGLQVAVSLKAENYASSGGTFGKNLMNRLYELTDETRSIHLYQPRAVVVGIFFLPLGAATDRAARSSTHRAVEALRARTGRTGRTLSSDLYKLDLGYVALYTPVPTRTESGENIAAGVLRLLDVTQAAPRSGRPQVADTSSLGDVVDRIEHYYRRGMEEPMSDAPPEPPLDDVTS
jgi:glycosyltransferase involved in cell wall biosynthesis